MMHRLALKRRRRCFRFWFRCGFLGLITLEIIRERLTREFDLELISTAPQLFTKFKKLMDQIYLLHNPADLPDINHINFIEDHGLRQLLWCPMNM